MLNRKVVVGASSCSLILLAACSGQTTTPPVSPGIGTVTSCGRDTEGFVRVGGMVQNLRDTISRVEITVGVFDALTGKQVDYTQAKSKPLMPNQTEAYTAAVYDINGQSSVPMYIRIQCRVVGVKVMDPEEVG